jgi:hypothetical protein
MCGAESALENVLMMPSQFADGIFVLTHLLCRWGHIMTQEALELHWTFRRARAIGILAEPHDHKVCDQCRSVSRKSARICPICGTYRFHSSKRIVVKVAKLIRASPFPYSAGVVPRF